MKKFKTLLFLFLNLALVAGTAVAADPPKKDKFGNYPPAGTAPSYLAGTVINPKTGKPMTQQEIQAAEQAAKEFKLEEARRLAEAERQRQKAERQRQEEAARRPRCSDFEYVGPSARPVSGGPTGYQCPPGYDSHMNGPLCECRWGLDFGNPHDPNFVIYADQQWCRFSSCQ